MKAWPKNFAACSGSSQSPIDIINPTYSNLGDIKFDNYEGQNVQITAKNNGHTYVATFNNFTEATTPIISGGGLPGEYKLAQFHFHWGSDHQLGSEHHVNGEDFPAEVGNTQTKSHNLLEVCKQAVNISCVIPSCGC